MKRIYSVLLATFVFTVMFCLCVSAQQVRPVYVTLNGEYVDCAAYGQEATIVEGRTLVPLRAIFEALGASVEWDGETRTVTSSMGDVTIKLTIGEKTLYRNGETVVLDVPAMIMNGRTLVPARAVAEAYGGDVEWDAETGTVIISTDDYKRGVINGRVYESEWIDLQYALAYGFEYKTEGELRRIMGVAEAEIYEDADYDMLDEVYEFAASDKSGNSVQLVCIKNTLGVSCDDYLNEAAASYKELGIECRIQKEYNKVIADTQFKMCEAVLYMDGAEIKQSFAVASKDKRLVVLMFTYIGDEYLEIMLDGFYNYREMIPYWRAKESPEIYGKLRFGMSENEAEKLLSGDINRYVNIITARDEKAEYDNEDEKITAGANVDFVSLEFENDALYNVCITTEYTTKEEAQKTKEIAEEYYNNLKSSFEIGTPSFKCSVVSTKMNGKTVYYCMIELFESTIYLSNGDNGDIAIRYERNEKKVPCEIEDTRAYGELYLGMSSEEVLSKVKGKIESVQGTDAIYVTDENEEYADEDEAITGIANAEVIALHFNNDVLYSVCIDFSPMTKGWSEQIVQRIIRYYGNTYTRYDESDYYTWELEDLNIDLRVNADEETKMYTIYLDIYSYSYMS